MYNERSNMYVQDSKFKIKLFTKLANQTDRNTNEVSKITLTNQFPFTLINPSIP